MPKMVQSEGCSPKRSLMASQQLKSSSDSIGNRSNSVPSHGKAKKRDKIEHADSAKRAHGPRSCDGHSDTLRNESTIKCQIAKITDKGGLFNIDGAGILLNLMQHDCSERKLDMAGKILLADVIAATDRFECLCRFMQLKGLLVLSDWLQEAHKCKIGDLSLKENGKSVEDLLLALLYALDKLPVDLHALQTSNIGKSVNNLRTHKNVEVQKKARSLVDTWKKRVDEEMTKIDDVKAVCGQTVSLSAKASFTEASHETGTCRTSPVKPNYGESALKSSIAPLGYKKSSSAPSSAAPDTRDLQCKSEGTSGTADMHSTMTKEEKINVSNQSSSNRLSRSGDQIKTMGTSCKDDARGSVAASVNPAKPSGSTSLHQKSTTDALEADVTGIQKEINSCRSSIIDQNKMSDKASQYGVTCEGKPDFPAADGNNKRLIIKFQRNPSQSGNDDISEENNVLGSKSSSLASPWRHDRNDQRRKAKEDVCQACIATDINVETRKNDAKKTVMSKEDDESSGAIRGSHGNNDENRKVKHMPKTLSSPSRKEKGPSTTEPKSGKSAIHSLNSMIALVESCVKNSEPSASNGSLSAGDDVGMDLLASVATGELSKCDQVPSVASPVIKLLPSGIPSAADEAKSGFQNILQQGPSEHANNIDLISKKGISNASSMADKGKLQPSCAEMSTNVPGSGKNTAVAHELVSLAGYTQPSVNPVDEFNERNITRESKLNCPSSNSREVQENNELNTTSQGQKKPNSKEQSSDCLPSQNKVKFPHLDKDMVPVPEKTAANHELKTKADGKSESTSQIDIDGQASSVERFEAVVCMKSDLPLDGVIPITEDNANISKPEKPGADNLVFSGSDTTNSGPIGGLKSLNSNDLMSFSETRHSIKTKQASSNSPVFDNDLQKTKVTYCTSNDGNHSRGNAFQEHQPTALATQEEATVASNHEGEHVKPMDSKLEGNGMGEMETDKVTKCDFDLNEGIMSNEGCQEESASLHSLMRSSAVTLPNFLPFTVPIMTSSSASPITVDCPAKGSFFPPENPSNNPAAPGWEGSAATSAFSPTEPRKILDMSPSASDASVDCAVVKENHPPLGIDLNVPDDRTMEEMVSLGSFPERCSASGSDTIIGRSLEVLDLDLNKSNEDAENDRFLLSTSGKLETPRVAFSSGKVNGSRQFDLNDGPDLEEVRIDPAPRNQQIKNSVVPLIHPIGDLKMSNNELGSLTSWLSQGNSHPPVAITQILPDRIDQTYSIAGSAVTQRFLGLSEGGVSFGGDMYRSPTLSSPAMAYSSATTFPYNGFPFNSSYPLAPASFSGGVMTYPNSSSGGGPCFPAVSSQIMGPANATSPAYMRPYLVIAPDSSASSNGSNIGQKWGKQCLDLNAGPGIADNEGREEKLLPTLRQPSISIPQAFPEEHTKAYHVPCSGTKRKEPESGWGTEKFPYKQFSWQ